MCWVTSFFRSRIPPGRYVFVFIARFDEPNCRTTDRYDDNSNDDSHYGVPFWTASNEWKPPVERERKRERFTVVGIETVTVSITHRIASITVRIKGQQKRPGLRNNRIRRETAATRNLEIENYSRSDHSDLSARIYQLSSIMTR